MKILSNHPFSLFANGGGQRILRRLYEGHAEQVTSLAVEGFTLNIPKGNIKEQVVFAFPVQRWWMRWKLRNIGVYLRHNLFRRIIIKKVQRNAENIDFDVIHVVNHGPYSAALCDGGILNSRPLWVSFHDHFSTTHSNFDDTKQLWINATRRLVISTELAQEYSKLFGAADYELITDGLTLAEVKQPKVMGTNPCTIYFAGLLHLEYMPLFATLADALEELVAQGQTFKLVLRGTQNVDFLNNRLFETEYRPVTLNNDELKQELDEADLLYLPIKFTTPDFYLYSLSTKMVGYLGAPGNILYHGPADSAACHLLKQHTAAIYCTTLNKADLIQSIKLACSNETVSANAKKLAQLEFDLEDIRTRFWQEK